MRRSLQGSTEVDVSVIIVSYNTKELTLQCIKSVIASISDLSYEIIIVDNGSNDETIKSIENLKLKINYDNFELKIIKNNENLGFAKANNQGIKIAKGMFVLLLNSDTVVKDNAIGKLIQFAKEKKDIGVVVPRLLNKDGSTQGSVFNLPTVSRALRQYWFGEKGLLDKYHPRSDNPVKVESAVMAAFLITPQALKKVGHLNENYFIYYEDLDYCRSVQREGLKVYYLPSAEVIHYHGESGKNIANKNDQWRRLIPSSKIYHGQIKHCAINFIIWSSQKWKR